MQANTITFNDSELHAVLINHTRYCLTRRSYAVGECCDLLRSKWTEIPENTQVIIRRDIKEAIEDDNRTIEIIKDKLADIDNREQDVSIYRRMDKCARQSWDRIYFSA